MLSNYAQSEPAVRRAVGAAVASEAPQGRHRTATMTDAPGARPRFSR